jgi:uncharacterized protein DUF4339
MQWYVSQNGKTTGPFDEERLAMLIHWGKISSDAFVCDEQHSAWIAIRCTAFGRGLPAAEPHRLVRWARAVRARRLHARAARAPSVRLFDMAEQGSKQALGLLAFSVIIAGVLAATL